MNVCQYSYWRCLFVCLFGIHQFFALLLCLSSWGKHSKTLFGFFAWDIDCDVSDWLKLLDDWQRGALYWSNTIVTPTVGLLQGWRRVVHRRTELGLQNLQRVFLRRLVVWNNRRFLNSSTLTDVYIHWTIFIMHHVDCAKRKKEGGDVEGEWWQKELYIMMTNRKFQTLRSLLRQACNAPIHTNEIQDG